MSGHWTSWRRYWQSDELKIIPKMLLIAILLILILNIFFIAPYRVTLRLPATSVGMRRSPTNPSLTVGDVPNHATDNIPGLCCAC